MKRKRRRIVYYVYTLADPRDNDIFYVGITNDINTRFQAHMRLLENNPEKNARIRSLQEENMAPHMEVIETVSDETTALEREKCWIDYFKQQGIHLTNIRKLKKGTREQHSKHTTWKDYDTAPEASKVLGVSIYVFRKLVREGEFSPLSFFPFLKQPLYARSQIDSYARNLREL
jgi:hypothetical protein